MAVCIPTPGSADVVKERMCPVRRQLARSNKHRGEAVHRCLLVGGRLGGRVVHAYLVENLHVRLIVVIWLALPAGTTVSSLTETRAATSTYWSLTL